jgi:hypothetical protein
MATGPVCRPDTDHEMEPIMASSTLRDILDPPPEQRTTPSDQGRKIRELLDPPQDRRRHRPGRRRDDPRFWGTVTLVGVCAAILLVVGAVVIGAAYMLITMMIQIKPEERQSSTPPIVRNITTDASRFPRW